VPVCWSDHLTEWDESDETVSLISSLGVLLPDLSHCASCLQIQVTVVCVMKAQLDCLLVCK